MRPDWMRQGWSCRIFATSGFFRFWRAPVLLGNVRSLA
jgi:hypothetical protein